MEGEKRAGREPEGRGGLKGNGKEWVWDHRFLEGVRARQSCFPVVLDRGKQVFGETRGEGRACPGDILLSATLLVTVLPSLATQLLLKTIPGGSVGGRVAPTGVLGVLGPNLADDGKGLLVAQPKGLCIGACVPVLQAVRVAKQLLCLAAEHLEVTAVEVEVVVDVPQLLPRDGFVVVQKESEEHQILGWGVLVRLEREKTT
jgi:hypothetical protein